MFSRSGQHCWFNPIDHFLEDTKRFIAAKVSEETIREAREAWEAETARTPDPLKIDPAIIERDWKWFTKEQANQQRMLRNQLAHSGSSQLNIEIFTRVVVPYLEPPPLPNNCWMSYTSWGDQLFG